MLLPQLLVSLASPLSLGLAAEVPSHDVVGLRPVLSAELAPALGLEHLRLDDGLALGLDNSLDLDLAVPASLDLVGGLDLVGHAELGGLVAVLDLDLVLGLDLACGLELAV